MKIAYKNKVVEHSHMKIHGNVLYIFLDQPEQSYI